MKTQAQYIRLADLEIDFAQLEGFNSAMKEGIETAVRVEPGVLALYAVSEEDNPTHVQVFEMYTTRERTRRIWKRSISKNSGPQPRTWLGPEDF
jgi:quinol monooxygenase YgiN